MCDCVGICGCLARAAADADDARVLGVCWQVRLMLMMLTVLRFVWHMR